MQSLVDSKLLILTIFQMLILLLYSSSLSPRKYSVKNPSVPRRGIIYCTVPSPFSIFIPSNLLHYSAVIIFLSYASNIWNTLPETEFLNFYVAQELIPPAYVLVVWRAGNPIPTWFLAPIDCSKIPALDA
jgi:hypothetical protein